MVVRRRAVLAFATLLAVSGCHAGTSGQAAKAPTPITRESLTVAKFVEEHNRTASVVQSLQAKPAIKVIAEDEYRVDGRLALERPRDFRLEISAGMRSKKAADIGSNDQGFWFWVNDKKNNQINVCDYEHIESSPLAITLQPDWIVEAMGLREFTRDEARTIVAEPVKGRPGMVVLTQFRKDSRGQAMTKETVIDEVKRHIVEHRLWAGAKEELLATATISNYVAHELTIPGAEGGKVRVEIPSQFRLDWKREKFAIEVTMGPDTLVNPRFDEDRRAYLFTEPKIPGVARNDLALYAEPKGSKSWVHESMPAPRPQPRSGVGLGQPEPSAFGDDGAFRSPGTDPSSPPATDLRTTPAPPPAGVASSAAAVVTAPLPRGSDSGPEQGVSPSRGRGPSVLIR